VSEEMRVPDYTNRIAGVRAWRVAPTLWAQMGGWLWSHAMLNPWPDGEENVAACDLGHDAPQKGCTCGLWAWFDYETLAREGYEPLHATHVAGIVGAAGRVVRGEIGWKAERVKVLALFDDLCPSPKREIADAFGGVPIIQPEEYAAFCDEMKMIRWESKRRR
jgi:hypothetical protein